MQVNMKGVDGREIKLNVWLPEGEITHAIVLSHGMSEHILRYTEFAHYCSRQGVLVVGANHRGHGAEAEILGHFADDDGWKLLLSDLNVIVDYVTKLYGIKPTLLGHSMGSFAARHYAILHGSKLASLVLCGSNYQGTLLFKAGLVAAKLVRSVIGRRTPSPFLEKLSFGNFNSRIKPLRTEQDWLCTDDSVVDAYIADPYCGFTPTPQFWIDLLGGLCESSSESALSKIPKTLPIWVISGDSDPVNNYGAGITALVNALKGVGIEEVESRIYRHARHELLNEVGRLEVYEDLMSWLKIKLS